jgi:hypothetical protein
MGLLGEISVNFVLDKEMKLWIIELNGKPQKSIYKDIKNFKYEQLIYRRPLEYAYFLSQSRPSLRNITGPSMPRIRRRGARISWIDSKSITSCRCGDASR